MSANLWLLSCLLPLFQNESSCEIIYMKMNSEFHTKPIFNMKSFNCVATATQANWEVAYR